MNNLKIYCLCIHDDLLEKVKNLDCIPVALGEGNYQKGWLRDNTGENISYKNKYFGEYTFHYWLWKNNMEIFNDKDWIGFCAYRRLWSQNKDNQMITSKRDVLKEVPERWSNNSVILGQPIHMDGWTSMKLIKHGLKSLFSKYFKSSDKKDFQIPEFIKSDKDLLLQALIKFCENLVPRVDSRS